MEQYSEIMDILVEMKAFEERNQYRLTYEECTELARAITSKRTVRERSLLAYLRHASPQPKG